MLGLIGKKWCGWIIHQDQLQQQDTTVMGEGEIKTELLKVDTE